MERDLLDANGTLIESSLTLGELARATGLSERSLRRLLLLGAIDPVGSGPEPRFPAPVLPRIHRIVRVARDLRINLAGMALVLDLLERIGELEEELARRAPARRG